MADRLLDNQDLSREAFVTSARLVQSRRTDDALLKLARQRANDPSIFDAYPPTFFSVEASNNSMDAYFTKMARNTLENFTADAKAGVSFQDSHLTRQLGLGATLAADLIEEGDTLRMVADVFTMGGLPDLDAFIHRYRASIARDVSVGFHGGKQICALCNRSIWDWNCPHVPGVEYDIETRDEQGKVTSKKRDMAFAWIDNARLSEISAVYDGATPGCAILKAQREADSGRMTPDVANLLEARYRGLHLYAAHHRWAGIGPGELPVTTHSAPVTTHRAKSEKGAAVMADETTNQSQPGNEPGAEAAARAASAAAPNPAKPETQAPDENARLITELITVAALPAEVSGDLREVSTHLRQMVADGKAYRERTIDEALLQGVRLLGKDFDKDSNRKLFERAGIEQVRAMADQWKAAADKHIPAGRQTADDAADPADEAKPRTTVREVPDSVFG